LIEEAPAGAHNSLHLRLPDGSRDLFAWTPGLSQPVEGGQPFVTDAPFVRLRLSPSGQPEQCFVLDGSYLEWEGRTLFEGKERTTVARVL